MMAMGILARILITWSDIESISEVLDVFEQGLGFRYMPTPKTAKERINKYKRNESTE